MKFYLVWCVFLLAFLPGHLFAIESGSKNHLTNIDRNGLAIKGYDPVSYFSHAPEKGNPEISASFDGAVYFFVSKDHHNLFVENPERYLPAYGSWCAWAMLEGDKVEINPERYKIINDTLYLFYDGFWGNTLSKWNKLAEESSEDILIESAQQHWGTLNTK